MKRAGGWLLGLLAAAAMIGGGWFALRNVLFSPTVIVVLMRDGDAHTVPANALFRGAAFALEEREGRAGKFKVRQTSEHLAWPTTAVAARRRSMPRTVSSSFAASVANTPLS